MPKQVFSSFSFASSSYLPINCKPVDPTKKLENKLTKLRAVLKYRILNSIFESERCILFWWIFESEKLSSVILIWYNSYSLPWMLTGETTGEFKKKPHPHPQLENSKRKRNGKGNHSHTYAKKYVSFFLTLWLSS